MSVFSFFASGFGDGDLFLLLVTPENALGLLNIGPEGIFIFDCIIFLLIYSLKFFQFFIVN